jgi:CBS domain-containing protein
MEGAKSTPKEGNPMKVERIMTADVKTCGPFEPLSAAVKIMWDVDCGIVPVVDPANRVVGVLTDRDICIACWSHDAKPSTLLVNGTMTTDVKTCHVGDSIAAAEEVMKTHQVRRLPVTDKQGRIAGIISLNDITREAERERERGVKRTDVAADEVVEALAAISRPRACTLAS